MPLKSLSIWRTICACIIACLTIYMGVVLVRHALLFKKIQNRCQSLLRSSPSKLFSTPVSTAPIFIFFWRISNKAEDRDSGNNQMLKVILLVSCCVFVIIFITVVVLLYWIADFVFYRVCLNCERLVSMLLLSSRSEDSGQSIVLVKQ